MHYRNPLTSKNTRFITNGIACIFIFCLIISLINFITTYNLDVKNSINSTNISFTNEGLKKLYNTYSFSFIIFQFCAALIVLFTTVSAMIIGLQNYLSVAEANKSIIKSNTENSLLNSETAKINFFNHQQIHKQFFFDYINQKIEKNNKIHKSSINNFILYNNVFKINSLNVIDINDNFNQLIKDITLLINESNEQFSHKKSNFFSHRTYQDNFIRLVIPFGISLSTCFRREFFDLENEILELLEEISFLYGNREIFPLRKYV